MASSLSKQVADAQAEMATWTPEQRASVQLEGRSDRNNVAAQAGDEPMPCPFCGGAPQVDEEHDDRGNRVIECEGCGANVGANMLSAGWRRWNQRVSPRATADVERDAARYRWLMQELGGSISMDLDLDCISEIDSHIDAAIATTKPGA